MNDLKKWCIIWLFVGLSFGGRGEVCAQVFGASARTEFLGGFGIRVFYGGISRTKLLLDGNEIANTNNTEVSVKMVPATIVYGLSRRLSIISVIPTQNRTFKRTVNGQELSDNHSGIGDVVLFGKYRFYKKDGFFRSRHLAAQLGLKLPTGSDNLKDGQGNLLPMPLQFGSGSVDYRFVLTITELRNRMTFTGDVGYTFKTETNGFKFGDMLNYDLAGKFRIYPAKYTDRFPARDLYGVVEINGSVGRKAKQDDVEIQNSGGHQVFISPGLQFLPVATLVLEMGVQIPVLQNLNGMQLGTDFNFRIGLRWFILP